jgi:polysaccharide export outer membrane protein
MRSSALPFFAGLLILSSCVPNRKLTLLQKNDVAVQDLPIDSVVRRYVLDTFDYKIQPYDLISVKFESLTPKEFDFFSTASTQVTGGQSQLIGELVDEAGEIPYPVVGKVKVAGLNIFQVQEKLQKIANQYVESPLVKVRLLNFRITVLGEVGRQGPVFFNTTRVTMMEAIGSAGGFTDLADRSHVKLIRQRGSKTEVLYIDPLREDFMTSPYYYVNQNDILVIRPLRQRPFHNYFGTNMALFVSILSLGLLLANLYKR